MKSIKNTYSTVQLIRDAYLKGLLSAAEAVDELSKKQTQKAWHSASWRELRNDLIKDSCEQCATKDPPMVLQHMWHPRPLGSLIREVSRVNRLEYAKRHPVPAVMMPDPEGLQDGCPHCGRFSGMNWRKTFQNWRCQHCRNIFDEKAQIPVLSENQSVVYAARVADINEKWYQKYHVLMEDSILSEALRIGFEEHDRYISCIDTKTFCKKCAFMWDINKKKLCEKKLHFIPVNSPYGCFTCNGTNDFFAERDAFIEWTERQYRKQDRTKKTK